MAESLQSRMIFSHVESLKKTPWDVYNQSAGDFIHLATPEIRHSMGESIGEFHLCLIRVVLLHQWTQWTGALPTIFSLNNSRFDPIHRIITVDWLYPLALPINSQDKIRWVKSLSVENIIYV